MFWDFSDDLCFSPRKCGLQLRMRVAIAGGSVDQPVHRGTSPYKCHLPLEGGILRNHTISWVSTDRIYFAQTGGTFCIRLPIAPGIYTMAALSHLKNKKESRMRTGLEKVHIFEYKFKVTFTTTKTYHLQLLQKCGAGTTGPVSVKSYLEVTLISTWQIFSLSWRRGLSAWGWSQYIYFG